MPDATVQEGIGDDGPGPEQEFSRLGRKDEPFQQPVGLEPKEEGDGLEEEEEQKYSHVDGY